MLGQPLFSKQELRDSFDTMRELRQMVDVHKNNQRVQFKTRWDRKVRYARERVEFRVWKITQNVRASDPKTVCDINTKNSKNFIIR